MRLIHMKCPDCGSILEADPTGKPVLFCQFCGSKLLIDDEYNNIHINDPSKAGYEFEQGRIKAQKEEQAKKREKEEKIAEASRVRQANYKKQYALAEQERDQRNAKHTFHGWVLFLFIAAVLLVFPGVMFVKVFIGLVSGCIIWAVQSAKCQKPYEHSYTEHADTDDEGNIIHVDRL